MKFTTLVPNIFYADINVGLKLFVECLGFKIEKSPKDFTTLKGKSDF